MSRACRILAIVAALACAIAAGLLYLIASEQHVLAAKHVVMKANVIIEFGKPDFAAIRAAVEEGVGPSAPVRDDPVAVANWLAEDWGATSGTLVGYAAFGMGCASFLFVSLFVLDAWSRTVGSATRSSTTSEGVR